MKRLGIVFVLSLSACVVQPQQSAMAPNAPTGSAPPGGGGVAGQPGSTGADTVVARGQFATLTVDNAAAFYEAVVFCLQMVGRADLGAQLNQNEFTRLVATHYPSGDQEQQQGLAQARAIWVQVQSQWPQLPQEDRIEFVSEVLSLAFGAQNAQALLGPAVGANRGGHGGQGNGAGQPGYGGADVNVDYEGSGCWAAAGCDFDSGSGEYTYEDSTPSVDVGGGDY